jgi:DNA polymerase-3 subunit alpha
MKLPDIPEWHDKEKLALEKEALGFLITGHPLDRYSDDIKRLSNTRIADMAELPEGSEVRFCGIVTAFKEITTKKGDRMGFVTIEDLTGSVEITVFSDIYSLSSTLLKSDDPLLIVGKLEKGEKGCKVLIMKGGEENNGKKFQRDRGPAGEIKLLSEARAQTTKNVSFILRTETTQPLQMTLLKEIIERHPGSVSTSLQFLIPSRSRSYMPLAEAMNVAASDELRLEVERLLGYNAATFE